MAEERNFIIKIVTETGEAVSNISTFFSGLDGGVERAKRAFQTLSQAAEAVGNVLSRGDAFLNVQASFNKIQAAAGNTAGIEKLRAAVGGVISDFELMKSANIAEGLGLTGKQFEILASKADAFADATGKDAVDALNAMVRAAGTGQDRMLAMYGVQVEGAKTSKEFVDKLAASIDKLAADSGSAGDAADKLKNALSNQIDKVAAAITKSKELTQALEALANLINSVDWSSWANSIDSGVNKARIAIKAGVADMKSSLDVLRDSLSVVSAVINLDPTAAGKGGSALAGSVSNNLQGIRDQQAAALAFGDIFKKTYDKVSESVSKTLGIQKQHTEETKKTGDAIGVVYGGTEKAAKAIEDAKKKQEQWNKVVSDLNAAEITDNIQRAIDSLDSTSFAKYKQQLWQATYDAFIEANRDLAGSAELEANAKRAADRVVQPYEESYTDANTRVVDDWQEKQEQAFETAADVWASLLSDAISGELFDSDSWKRELASVGTEIGSNILAGLTVGGGGGGGSDWGSMLGGLFGSYFGGSGGSNIGPVADGDAYGGMIDGGGGGGTFSGSFYEILARLYIAMWARNFEAFQNADTAEAKWVTGIGAAIDSIFPGVGSILSTGAGYLGIGSAGPGLQQQNARDELLEFLEDQYGDTHDFAIQGVSGGIGTTLGLNSGAYNVDMSNPLAGGAIGLVQGLADVLVGGDDKLGDDLAGIFANATLEGQNFNEVLINASALLDAFGVTAEQGKDQLKDLFLEGSVSLEEFGAGIQGFNTLATENLVGEGSVNDALNIIFNNLETKPRVAVKGLELLWQELGEKGITSLQGFSDYLSGTFGVDAQAAFDAISAAGITSFENLATLSADQLFALLNALTGIADDMQSALGGSIADGAQEAGDSLEKLKQRVRDFGSTFASVISNATNSMADDMDDAAGRIIRNLREIQEEANQTADAIEGAQSSGGGRPNTQTRRGVYPSVNRLNRAEL